MKKTKNTKLRLITLIAVASLALLAVIGGTLAYLMDETEPVKNTFTFGNINITLTETNAVLNEETGEYENEYKVMPGDTITKDPVITVKEGSEPCWLYVKLEKTYKFTDYMTFDIAEGWTQLPGWNNVWYREVPQVNADTEFHVLKDDAVHVKPEITKEQVDELKQMPYLKVTAYAVQRNNFEDPVDAFNAKDIEFIKDESALKNVIGNRNKKFITLAGDVVVEEPTKAGVDAKTGEELTTLVYNRTVSQTVDLADYTLCGKEGMDVDYGLYILGNLSTKVVLNADKGGIDLSRNGSAAYCVYLKAGSSAYKPSLTINGGVYKGGTSCVQLEGGICTINGGYFEVTDSDAQYMLNIVDPRRDSSQFVITGGTFVNFDPSNVTNEGDHHTYVAEGYHVETSEVEGKTLYTVVADK